MSGLRLALVLAAAAPCFGSTIYEAEHAALIGQTSVARDSSAATGRAWVTGFVTHADAVDFTVNAPEGGYYQLDFVYSADAEKRIPVLVNGRIQGSRLLPKTTGFETRPYGRIVLAAGDNTLRVGTDWGYADLDAIRISPAAPPAAFDLASVPVNPAASPEARALFTRLTSEFGRRVFVGQHDSDTRRPTRLDQVARLTDDAAPAILGLDLQLDSGAWINPEPVGAIDHTLDWARERGGIVTLSWHWLSPFGGIGDPVWDTFSTARTTFDVARLADETSPEYLAVVADLDRVAAQLARLRDARVPVLWRPLHEAEGRWFWWGARGPEATKRLYRLMFDRFTRVHGLDNLIWVWTSTDDDGALAWYPGDEYVDIVAADLYFPPGVRGDLFTTFDRLRELYRGRKPLALGECGAPPEFAGEAPWLWFLIWDDFITRSDFNPPDLIKQIYRDPRVITLPGR